MKGTGAKRNVCPGSCVSTGAKFPVAPVESAPMKILYAFLKTETFLFARFRWITQQNVQGGPNKRRHRLMTIILSNLNRLKN